MRVLTRERAARQERVVRSCRTGVEREDDFRRAQAASARVFARGPSWPPVPGVFARERMSRAQGKTLGNYVKASCARAGAGVFAGPERNVGQFFDGAASFGR